VLQMCLRKSAKGGNQILMIGIPLIVAGLDEQVEVGGIDGVRNQQVGGNNAKAVVIGLGIECSVRGELLAELGTRGLAVEDGVNQNEGDTGFIGDVLVNRHGLDAVDNVLQVADIAVLAGDDGLILTGIVRDDGLGNTGGGGVVGAEGDVKHGAVAIVGGQGVLEVLQSGVGAPGGSGDLLKGGLAGGDLQGAGIDEGLEGIEGAVEEVGGVEPLDEKFRGFGFNVIKINGHDFDEIENAFTSAKTVKDVPTVILAKTVKGKDVSFMENQVGWHGTAPNKEQYEIAMKELELKLTELEALV